MKKVTFAILMAFLLLLAACDGTTDVSEVIEDVAQEVGEVAEQVGENADEIAEAVEDAADTAVETAEEVMMSDLEELTVAYFLEWPTPNQFAQIQKTYDDALGIPVNWVSFDTGVAMSAAMASGDVHIAYSQGLVPFANAVSAGLDLQTVGIAVSYAENDNCVAATDLGITRDNVTDLHGMQVAVPIGTVAHYKMLKEMEYLGVDVSQLELVDLAPADGAAALQRGDVAMACGWGGGLARMKESGNIIMTGAEMEAEIGLKVFDVVSVTGDFAKDHGDIITTFLQVTEDANGMYASDPASMQDVIAEAAGMELEASNGNLATFSFPTADEQLSDAWMGGTVQNFVKEVADFFVEQGELESALDSYDAFINTSFLEAVTSAPSMMMDDSMEEGEMMDAGDVKVCQVTDVGGIDDKSFNATAWAGAERAAADMGIEVKFLESQQQTDYDKNISAFIDDGCDLIISVGFLMGDATAAAAEANPDQQFAIIDVDYLDFPNLQGIGFAIDQAGFLAGYTAANASETGIIGTFGGINIPPVTAFMDGYVMGANYYNSQNGADVQVLGWDIDTQDGLFTGNFESTDDGRAFGESLMDEGADVIMPVAGPVGLGTAAAIQERGGAWIVGVDTDWTVSAPEFADIVLTSVLKRLDTAVYSASEATVKGTFEGGLWIGDLANDGVGISDPAVAVDGLDAIIDGIIAGSIPTHPGQEAMMASSDEEEAMVDGAGAKVCQITDVGGIDDKSFNATAWLGVELAMEQFGVEGKFLESQQQADYDKNIDAFIGDACDLIVTVGFLLGDATATAAEANPEQDFVILDFAYDPAYDNVQGVVFASNQNAFLAGYAAASVSESGIVATYGGINIPPVTDFMDGYVLGVAYYNEQNGTDVQVLGWDIDAQDGVFTGNFESTDDGRAFADSLMDEGADVIFPLAGAANIGTASAVQERGGAWVIGVDSDFAAVLPEFADVIFMSTLKRLDTAVLSATEQKLKDEFEGGVWVGTLENDGVGITTPTIDIPGLEDVRAGIIAGDIVTTP